MNPRNSSMAEKRGSTSSCMRRLTSGIRSDPAKKLTKRAFTTPSPQVGRTSSLPRSSCYEFWNLPSLPNNLHLLDHPDDRSFGLREIDKFHPHSILALRSQNVVPDYPDQTETHRLPDRRMDLDDNPASDQV